MSGAGLVPAGTPPGTPALLDRAAAAARGTEPEELRGLLRAFVGAARGRHLSLDGNLARTLGAAVAAVDARISEQLSAVMHHPDFQRLEGTWRGARFLAAEADTGATLKVRLLDVSKRELQRDLSRAVEFDQSQIFRKVYETEFGTSGGEPFSVLIGDYAFGCGAEDVDILAGMSGVAAAAFAPFVAAAAPDMFGLDGFEELSRPRDLARIFEAPAYAKWRAFRDSEDSRFAVLTLPRVLARMPYGSHGTAAEGFDFQEMPADHRGGAGAMPPEAFTWMNASFALGTRLCAAFAGTGWCTAIRGAEGGGKVGNLPTFAFRSDDGDVDRQCPTEIGITDRREAELSRLGFLPLCHYKGTGYAVFFGSQTVQRPRRYDSPDAAANAAISARLPYILATSRIAHYLKVMGRDKVGSFLEASDAETWLNAWIRAYVNGNAAAGPEIKARYPLAEARVSVREVPGTPGTYNAVAYLRPWLHMEELTTSMRLVARIPAAG